MRWPCSVTQEVPTSILIEDTIAGGCRDSPLCGRDPKHDVHLKGQKACHGTVVAAVRTLDFETGARPTNVDMAAAEARSIAVV